MRPEVVVVDAPSNLGLRPPKQGSVPGCYKMPWALRNAGLLKAIQASDAGCVVPPRYEPDWDPGHTTRNSRAIADYSLQLASRLHDVLESAKFPVVVGGDCSVLIGAGLALKRRGRYGLVFLDAHSDFRHPENSGRVEAAAGEDLAISLGYGDPRLTNLSGEGPNFLAEDVAVLGVRDFDEHLDELTRLGVVHFTSTQVSQATDQHLRDSLAVVTQRTDGFWVHVDFDVVDSTEMHAADCPEPDGLSFLTLSRLLGGLVKRERCVGIELTIYDPDLDRDGVCATRIVDCLGHAFSS
ncbi:MAG: arginase family protein [Thermoanaerobaculia bacterium]|nr:arginase family protein [Thermoanaerobaculia bacterium]